MRPAIMVISVIAICLVRSLTYADDSSYRFLLNMDKKLLQHVENLNGMLRVPSHVTMPPA